jgi:phosphatidylserine/phosphatidylglycerophosphate/cardiolipin synthase-like enzyme
MKRFIFTAFSLFLIALPAQAEQCDVQAHFTPIEKMTPIVISELQKAKKGVYLSLFGITNKAIADELISLHAQGVDVRVNLDHRQSMVKGSLLPELHAAGIPVVVKPTSALEHNKFMVIDPGTPHSFLFFGSWNFSESAEKQDNSAAILRDCPGTIQSFMDDFNFITKRDGVK